ncbi:hypothetical protein UlMin_031789 [Ulmus minor]
MHSFPRVQKNKLANANWLSERFTEELRPGGNFRLGDFLGKVKQEYVLTPSKSQVYRAKRKAGLLIEGSLASQYGKLWDYAEELKRSNPGTTVVIYICLHACKLSWLNVCRPIIRLDGCHIKGYHKSQLLLAIGIDVDNGYYPVEYAMVEKECYTSWFWFLDLLKLDLRLERSVRVTFMTDKQKGLVEAISLLFDGCEHRNCVHHLYANFQLKFKNQLLRGKVWQAARVTIVTEFTRVMQEIKNISEEAHNWLSAKPATQWSRSHFREFPKCDMLLNNLCKSINGDTTILEARSLSIYSLLEAIRVKIMNRRSSKRLYMDKWHADLGPKV